MSTSAIEDPMSDMLAELKKKASQLSDAERAELALSLIESPPRFVNGRARRAVDLYVRRRRDWDPS